MIPHNQWCYACPVVYIQFLLAFARMRLRRWLGARPRPLQPHLVSSGLPLYAAAAHLPCLQVRPLLITRLLGCGFVSQAVFRLAQRHPATIGQPLRVGLCILRRVFAGCMLARTLNAGLCFDGDDSLCSDLGALQLQSLPAFNYLRARHNVTWWDAARCCNVHDLAAHIDLGADVNSAEHGSGWTVLHWAGARGSVLVIELAISCGARINARDRGGCSALHIAARNDRTDAASVLIACGAEVDARGSGGCTPLHMAAHRGYCSVMRLLIACDANIAAECDERRTALHWAAHEGHCDALLLLISSRADLDASAGGCGMSLLSLGVL
jgi:hypothetical protein